ncbi:MAG TPA: DinB family protein [Vicinamibacterales bacterium]|nr:DinB family protein [Vicinamibacterales bacterium]
MNAEQDRAIVAALSDSIESESAVTRKVIAAVPSGNRDYKPDPKSRTAWEIATHMATSDIWFADCILKASFEWTGEPPLPPEFTDPAAVAKWHETHLADRLAKIRALTPEQLLREADFFGTRGPVVTFMVPFNNHHIHHRGQLAAYLRAAGSKVPAIYGMSADENLFAQG